MRGTCVLRFSEAHGVPCPYEENLGTRSISERARNTFTALAVWEHLLDGGDVPGTHQRQLFQFAHAAGGFRAHQVALARVHALDFAVRGDFETLFGAAMGFQL